VSPWSGARSAPTIRLWSLREDVLVEVEPAADQVVVVNRWGEVRVDGADEVVRESLRRMGLGPVWLENVFADRRSADQSSGPDGPTTPEPSVSDDPVGRYQAEWANLHRVLDLLRTSVVHSLGSQDGEGPLLSAVPVGRSASFDAPEVDRLRPVRLSRFAAMRAKDGTLRLESPLSRYHVVLHRQLAAQVIAALGGAITITDIADMLDAPNDDVADILSYLAATGIVVLGEWRAAAHTAWFAEDTDPKLVRWSHHDLMFHAQSRLGRSDEESGPVFPHAEQHPVPPLVKPVHGGGAPVALYRPPRTYRDGTDTGLDRHVTAEALGELLFRAARIRAVDTAATGTGVRYEVSDRPYLSSNGLYELELYVIANACTDLDRAIYHYDPSEHVLTLVHDNEWEMDALLDEARVAARTESRPAAMVTITARVDRSSWMYSGIGYSLTLTHVGALQQTLCLVATDMGLAACAPAVDPGDLADSVLRLDWPAEVGVGEFIVG
jgi:SagB-type dehydrogenase family enzyme